MAEPFSVLLPVYAGDIAEHFRRAVLSVTADQKLKPAELVVVQDGPVPPEVARVIEEVGSGSISDGVASKIVRLPVNQGLAKALEVGLGACSFEIVARADADDISLPERFARQVPVVSGEDGGEGLDLLGSAITEFECREDELGTVRRWPCGAGDIARVARVRDPFNHPSVVYRKSAVEAAGGYEELDKMEDYWLFARMLHAGARVANLPESLVLYRVGAGAYGRRGGLVMLRSELKLQREMRRLGFTGWLGYLRNVAVRGGYRLVPAWIRRPAYRGILGTKSQ